MIKWGVVNKHSEKVTEVCLHDSSWMLLSFYCFDAMSITLTLVTSLYSKLFL